MATQETGAGQDDHLQEMFRRAAAVAATVPPALQEAAFNRALDALMSPPSTNGTHRDDGHGSSRSASGSSRRSARGGQTPGEAADDPVAALIAMPRSNAEPVDDEDGALGKSLALLRVAEDQLQISGLSASQIATVLTNKFKWKVTRQAVGQALDRAGKMVDSSTKNGARSYTIMDSGLRYLDTPADQRLAPSGGTGGARRRSRASKAAPAKAQAKSDLDTSGPAKKAASRRPGASGPREAVEQLLTKGFFKEPRLLGAIREELKDTRGLVYKSTDLSPTMTRMLREGKLNRNKNADGQYEYIDS